MTIHISLEDGNITLEHAVSVNKGRNFHAVLLLMAVPSGRAV
jgi:hypothetical protein